MTNQSVLLAACVLLAGGCSEEDAPPPDAGAGNPGRDHTPETREDLPDVDLQCFTAGGGVAFHVDGVPVPRGSFERFTKGMRRINPEATEYQCQLAALEKVIMPLAAVYARFREHVPRMETRMQEILNELESGRPFSEVAARHGDLPKLSGRAGDLGFLPMKGSLKGLEPVTRIRIWELEVGETSEPFLDLGGAALIRVEDERAGAAADNPERKVRAIFLRYETDSTEWQRVVRKAIREARVTSVSAPDLEELIPKAFRRGR